MISSLTRTLAIVLAVSIASISSLAHAGDDGRPAGRAAQLKAAQLQSMRVHAARQKAAQAQAAHVRMSQAQAMQMRQAQAAQMRQAQAAKAGMATAMVTAATLAATDAGECSPYLAKWMTTKNPAWQARYEACMDDD